MSQGGKKGSYCSVKNNIYENAIHRASHEYAHHRTTHLPMCCFFYQTTWPFPLHGNASRLSYHGLSSTTSLHSPLWLLHSRPSPFHSSSFQHARALLECGLPRRSLSRRRQLRRTWRPVGSGVSMVGSTRSGCRWQ